MGSQSSKAPQGDVTAEEAAGPSPAKANGQENGHVKSNGDLTPKGEGESPPVNGTDEAAGDTGDAIEPAPPSQEAEAKGEVAPKETPKKKKKFSFKKPFKLSGLSFKRNRKEGGGDSSASSPTEEEQEQGEISACRKEGTAQEGKAAATPESQEPQAKGAEASAASKGGDTEEEAGPQAAEPSTPLGPQEWPCISQRWAGWVAGWGQVGDLLSCKNCAVLVRSLPGPGALADFLCPEKGLVAPFQPCSLPPVDSPISHLVLFLRPVEDGPLRFPKLG